MFIAGLMILASQLSAQIFVSGPVSGTWTDSVYVTDNIWIAEGESLTIEAGSKVVFTKPGLFNVWGTIHSNGTASSPVVFTVSDTSGFADSSVLLGAWQGLVFSHVIPTTDSSIFNYTRFEYTKDKRDAGELSWGGAITANEFGKLRFSHCSFFSTHSWSGGGAASLTGGADAIFSYCTFENCRVYDSLIGFGGALYALNASPVVEHCLFSNNVGVWLGGGLCFYYSDPLIRFNEFKGNSALVGAGISLVHCRPARIISNNVIHHNGPAYFGGGVACNNACDPIFVNNTIVENFAAYGGGFYCNDYAAPTVINTIITDNITAGDGQQVYIWDVYSHPNFYYCNITGGKEAFAGSGALGGYHGIFENNLDTLNYFDAGSVTPWVLSDQSPLRDAGIPDTSNLQIPGFDFAGQLRMVKTRIDIGALEWQSGAGLAPRTTDGVTVSPNPSAEHVTIKLPGKTQGLCTITVTDAAGRQVFSKEIPATDGVLQADLSSLKTATPQYYILSVKGALKLSTSIIIR